MERKATEFIISAVLLLLPPLSAGACISEGARHNNYLFSVFHRSMMDDRFEKEVNDAWRSYCGVTDEYFTYRYNRDKVMSTARSKCDNQMITYLKYLNDYLDSNSIYDGWEYPTKEQVRERTSKVMDILAFSRKYSGKRFAARYALLTMRAYFTTGSYQQAADYWRTTGSRLPQSVYRDMMENIYAGCLYRLGSRREAVEIYARQEDFRSLKYCVNKKRSLEGIRQVYGENPNSPTLVYLVQDFVNNTQETIDALAMDRSSSKVDEEWFAQLDCRPHYKADIEAFISFARTVIAEGRTSAPCLWQTAIGCLEYLMADYSAAKADLEKAVNMAGTQRMRENARAIYAVNSVNAEPLSAGYGKWLVGELRWLDEMAYRDAVDKVPTDDHYNDVRERLVYRNLIPKYESQGLHNEALLLYALMADDSPQFYQGNCRSPYMRYDCTWNGDYSTEYFGKLDVLTSSEAKAYYRLITGRPSGAIEQYALSKAYRDADFYNDLIGTKLLGEGKFDEAEEYLSRVSLDFVRKQNIAGYEVLVDYNADKWFSNQSGKQVYDNIGSRLSENKKLTYCRTMQLLEREYRVMRKSEVKLEKAYKLASLYYQASYEGDCWWLKQYGLSCLQDSVKPGTKDFVQQAIDYLEESVRSSDRELMQKSAYALAFIRRDPWIITGWDSRTNTWYSDDNPLYNRGSRQYKALRRLAGIASSGGTLAPYISHCDVLKQFRSRGL